jgi:hypothetical protein
MKKSVSQNTLLLVVCFVLNTVTSCAADPPLNSLTPEEKAAGWRLLFDGHSLAGWCAYGKTGGSAAIGAGWQVEDGLLKKKAGERGGDIITVETYSDFQLEWEWRIEQEGNNGVKYLVTESRPAAPGHEYQMIDDQAGRWRDLMPKHGTASFYDVLPAAPDKPVKSAGEWNLSRIVLRGSQVEHWLNGKKVLEYELNREALGPALEASKFKDFPDFGSKIRGHIMLTDHQDEAWFRNIKLLKLAD